MKSRGSCVIASPIVFRGEERVCGCHHFAGVAAAWTAARPQLTTMALHDVSVILVSYYFYNNMMHVE